MNGEILSIETAQKIARLEKENQELNSTIQKLNEIIKVKDHEIENYENMRAVKLTKKLRGLKE